MTETKHSNPSQTKPASPVRKTAARAAQAGISLVWLVPILVLLATLGMAYNAYSQRGALITVAFSDATGITPEQTALKFRDVTVGQVESVRFSKNLEQVLVDIRVEDEVAPFIDEQAEFWIVRPQVSAQGITRLDTVLSGVFIEGYWDAERGNRMSQFTGAERAPLTREDAKGTWIILSSEDAEGLAEGAPILYRGLNVGRMQNLRLSEDDESVIADAFIEAPYDRRLSTATAFWDSSGFSISLGTDGLSVDVESLSSLLQGGAAFETLTSGGEPITDRHVFRLLADEDAARNALFVASENDLRLTMLVDGAINGLAKGADVEFQGVNVGRVTDLSVLYDEDSNDNDRIQQAVTLAISPGGLGLEAGADRAAALTFLRQRVAAGLRARVASSGFLGRSLMVELVNIDRPEPAQITDAEPYPIIPAAPPEISDVAADAQGLISRIGELPIEDTLRAATRMMDSVTSLAIAEDTRAIPKALRGTLDEAQTTLDDLGTTAKQLRESAIIDNADKALADAAVAVESLKAASTDLPATLKAIEEAAIEVEKFGFEEISTEAEGILADLRVMLGSEDAEQLPRNLSDVLKTANGLLGDLRDGDATGSLNKALDSAASAADEVARAVQDLPTLSARLQQLSARAEGVIASYGERGRVNQEVQIALRELSRAAASFGSLARTIERNPRAFILGR